MELVLGKLRPYFFWNLVEGVHMLLIDLIGMRKLVDSVSRVQLLEIYVDFRAAFDPALAFQLLGMLFVLLLKEAASIQRRGLNWDLIAYIRFVWVISN